MLFSQECFCKRLIGGSVHCSLNLLWSKLRDTTRMLSLTGDRSQAFGAYSQEAVTCLVPTLAQAIRWMPVCDVYISFSPLSSLSSLF